VAFAPAGPILASAFRPFRLKDPSTSVNKPLPKHNPPPPETSPAADRKADRRGYLFGLLMAVGSAFGFAAARAGILGGLSPAELVLMRFGVAGLILLPFLIRWGLPTLAGIGWRRGLILALFAGPLFAILQMGGYAFAPLAHGAVIAPATVTILSTIAAGLFLGERLGPAHIAGAVLVVGGVLLVSWDGLATSAAGGQSWIGDLMFFASSVLWVGFTICLRHWRLDALRATAVVSVLSLAVTVPGYLILMGGERLMSLSFMALAAQGVMQGALMGVLTLLAYGRTVALLGVSRAVLFPATVPAFSILVGIPVVGEVPNATQIAGLVLVTAGLLTAIGFFNWLRRR